MTTLDERPVSPALKRRSPEHLGLAALLVLTAAAYLWRLGESGWANTYYSGAVQAGSRSLKAAFFGASDIGGSITVDKPPLSLWFMEVSVRLFGLSSWSILVPQAVLGVAAVALLWGTVRRHWDAPTAFIAAGLLAITPVVVLMFRFNNPDAMLTFLSVAALWALLRAIDSAQIRWAIAFGAFLGLGFLAKQMQVMLVAAPLVAGYALTIPGPLRARAIRVGAAVVSAVVVGGWWFTVVAWWPVTSRPFIGGTKENSITELTFGTNGVSRLEGKQAAPGAPTPEQLWGASGPQRLFSVEPAGQAGWLLPAAIILSVAVLVVYVRRRAWSVQLAGLTIVLAWLAVTAVVFSYMSGTFHSYYTVALAPAIALLTAVGVVTIWRLREQRWAATLLATTVAVTSALAVLQLGRDPDYLPALKWIVGLLGVAAFIALLMWKRSAVAVGILTAAACLLGPLMYCVTTIDSPHRNGVPLSGPRIMHTFTGPGERPSEVRPVYRVKELSPAAIATITRDADQFRWAAATIGANPAAGFQLVSGVSVMPIGGFRGSDSTPSLDEFQELVRTRQIHYFLDWDGPTEPGSTYANTIREWVRHHFASHQLDDDNDDDNSVAVYDLTA